VLNNRWTAEESLDENLYRTRTIEGKLRVKHIGLNPQSYKLLVIPKLAVGWKRMRARFTTSANGLTMSYSLTDREMASAPPSPATTWNATYTETTTNNAAITKGEVAVSMEGPPDADKRMLLQRCGEVVLQRLPDIQNHKILSDGGEYDGKPVIESAAIIEFLHKNAVEMRVRVRHVSTPTRIHNMVLQHFGRPLALPNYTPKTQVIPAQFDASSPTGIFAMYVQNPYDDYHGLLPTDTGSDYAAEQVQYFQEEPTSPGDSGDPDSGGGEDVETDDKKFVSDDQAKGPYTEWTSMTTALAATGTYAVPFAEQLEDATTDTTTDKPEGQPSVKHISLHKNISRLVVSYTATRDHNKPEFPESPATWENNGITYKKESSKEVELGGRTGAGGIASYRSRQTTYYTAVSPIKKRVDPVQDPSVVKPANVKPGVPEDITPLSGGASNLNGSDEGRAYWKPISPD